MLKLYCYLSQQKVDQLEQIKKEEGHRSTSAVMKEMIDLGLKVYLHNKDKGSAEEIELLKKEAELNRQHTRYLLRILSLNNDILRCVYDNNKFPEESGLFEDHIAKMKQKVDHYIDGYINN